MSTPYDQQNPHQQYVQQPPPRQRSAWRPVLLTIGALVVALFLFGSGMLVEDGIVRDCLEDRETGVKQAAAQAESEHPGATRTFTATELGDALAMVIRRDAEVCVAES